MTQRHVMTALALVSGLSLFGIAPEAEAQRRPARGRRAVVVAQAGRQPIHSSLQGRLTARDQADEQGRHVRSRTLPLRRGDQVRFALASEEVDTVAIVEGPNGQRWEDDDGAGEGTDSLLRFVAPADGVYRFVVTTYEAGQTGRFSITLDVTPAGLAAPDDGEYDNDGDADDADDADDDDSATAPSAPANNGTGGQTYGVFVGITSYGGEGDDLPGSAQDAVDVARAFEQAGWMQRTNAVVLTDARATAAGVRQAFSQLAPRVGPNDTFVFFYDGHGNTNVLGTRGSDLRRDELDRLLGRVQGRQLVVLDSCHAGGFASIIRGHEGRYGLFSSRADELSSTAPSVNAGGWLAYFLREGVAGGAPRAADGSVSFRDLTRYVQERYDREGVSRRQHLVVATGSSSASDFALGGPSVGTGVEPTTVVASNTGHVPVPTGAAPTFPQFPGGAFPNVQFPNVQFPGAQFPGAAPAGLPTTMPNGDLGALVNTGFTVANAFLGALTK